MSRPQVVIRSEGTGPTTSVEVDGATVYPKWLSWTCDGQGVAKVTMEVGWGALEVLGDLTRVEVIGNGPFCPWCGKLKMAHNGTEGCAQP